MNNVWLCYKTDVWHTYDSRELIGIAETKGIAISICKKKARKENHILNTVQLDSINQTQGYTGEGEFVIEPIEKNVLL